MIRPSETYAWQSISYSKVAFTFTRWNLVHLLTTRRWNLTSAYVTESLEADVDAVWDSKKQEVDESEMGEKRKKEEAHEPEKQHVNKNLTQSCLRRKVLGTRVRIYAY